jgi:hypothetical protein
MVLRNRADARCGEDVEDLRAWLTALPGSPPVHETVVLACGQHGDERPNWQYVEADPVAGVARRRCLACATVVPLLDSDDRWTHPPMWACKGCGQSITELAVGLSVPDGEHVEWLAVGVRCIECGRVAGVTDLVLPGVPLPTVLAGL